MLELRLSQVFSPWFPTAQPPGKPGWYRVRTDAIRKQGWDQLAYFDGQCWWTYIKEAWNRGSATRVRLLVLKWQGLCAPAKECSERIRQHLAAVSGTRKHWLSIAQLLEQGLEAPRDCAPA